MPDERILRPQIENVELVDARRHDEQRPLVDLGGGRSVLDELDQLVAEHDAARREGEVAADRECRLVGHGDAAALCVADQVGESLGEAGAAGLEGELKRLGIGRQEIRRRDGVRVLLGEEAQPLLRPRVALRQRRELAHVIGIKQVAVLEPGEVGLLAPFLRREAPIHDPGHGAGLCCGSGVAAERLLPERFEADVVAFGELGRGGRIDPCVGRCQHRQRGVSHFDLHRGCRCPRGVSARPPLQPLPAHRLPLAEELGQVIAGRFGIHRHARSRRRECNDSPCAAQTASARRPRLLRRRACRPARQGVAIQISVAMRPAAPPPSRR